MNDINVGLQHLAAIDGRPTPDIGLRILSIPGLRVWGGNIYEEEQKQLKSLTRRLTLYRQMRRDAVVGTLLDALKAPLLSADFDVVPGGDSRADVELADLLTGQLLEGGMGSEWRQHVEDMLEMLEFGFALAEVQFQRLGGAILPTSLSPIGQETLSPGGSWIYDPDAKLVGVRQLQPVSGRTVEVPYWKLLHFTIGSRKRNPEGESLLASIWKEWRFRQDLEVMEGIGIERDVAGMPIIYPPKQLTASELTDVENQFGAMRMDERSVVIMPGPKQTGSNGRDALPGWSVEPWSGGAKQYDIRTTIRDYDSKILMRWFAQFLKLGMDRVGTQALVQGSQDFFAYALRGIQQRMLEVWNNRLVPLILLLNPEMAASVARRPKLHWTDPGAPDIRALVDLYGSLTAAQVLVPTEVDEDHVRSITGLPDRMEGVAEGVRGPMAPAPPLVSLRRGQKTRGA